MRTLALTQSEMETVGGRCLGNTLSVSPAAVLQIHRKGKGKGRETTHPPGERWRYLDQRGSREVVTCLDSG